MRKITVEIGSRAHRYDILVASGLCRDFRGEVERRVPADRYILMADARLASIAGLPETGGGGKWSALSVEPGEPNKTLAQYGSLCERALALGMDRKTAIVALGGGVVGDIAGFAAATLMRGVRLVMIPTTLLAMADSSVGGKNGVNVREGKNLVGSFHQPELVLVDPAFLATLPRREYLAGLAEIVKTAVIEGNEFFSELSAAAAGLSAMDADAIESAVARCCRVKAAIVSADEREGGERALLNLGHTFGHVLESLAGYDGRVVHGEAVAVGMALASDFAAAKGFLAPEAAAGVKALLRRLELPTAIRELGRSAGVPPDWPALVRSDAMLRALSADKKNSGGSVTLVLPFAIGDCRAVKGNDVGEVGRFVMRNVELITGLLQTGD